MSVLWIITPKRSAAIGAIAAVLALGCSVASAGNDTFNRAVEAGNASALNGEYAIDWSQKELLAAGASQAYVSSNFGYLQGRHGGITMKLQDGRFRLAETLLPHFQCSGTYAVVNTTVTIQFTTGCYGQITARWSLQRGQLRLHVSRATDPGDKVTFGGKPWKKVV